MAMRVYLDNAATTAVIPEVLESMIPFFSEDFGNAQSVHWFGQRAKAAVESARRQAAALIGALPSEVVFVSGGTESDNLAIRGIAESHSEFGRHIITTKIEHPAVLATCRALERSGFTVDYLPVSRDGSISIEDLREALRPDTILVSVMHANNETGVIQPLEEIGRIVGEARSAGNEHIHFHTDAVQSAAKIPIDVQTLGADLLSLTAHKFHGPKGAGALYVRRGTRLSKLLQGGHQERDRRAGTENVAAIVGLGRAAEIANLDLQEKAGRVRELRDRLEERLLTELGGCRVNGSRESRISSVSNMSFDGLDGESLLIALDLKGVAVSTGSACSSGSLDPSHVLVAMGLSREEVRGSLRFSLGIKTTAEEIDFASEAVIETVSRFRQMAPGPLPGSRAR